MTAIAFLNQKGGAAKTTLSVCISTAFKLDGLAVHLVDSDPQGSASDWHAMAVSQGADVVSTSQLARPVLHREVPRMAEDVVIIDGAPRSNALTESAMEAADLILIPVQPSALDIWATKELVQSVHSWIERREGSERPLKAAFVLTRVLLRSSLGQSAGQALEAYGLPVLDTVIAQRQDYPNTIAMGMTPLDLRQGNKARQEIIALKDEIIRLLAN